MPSTIIAAIAKNNVIGNQGRLPWEIKDLSEDIKRFKEMTMGHPIIMGRKTFESIGQPLYGRTNLVISKNPNKFNHSEVAVINNLELATRIANCIDKENYIIGGSQIYSQAIEMPCTKKLEITEINKEYKGDTFFPEINLKKWQETSRIKKDFYDFVTYERK